MLQLLFQTLSVFLWGTALGLVLYAARGESAEVEDRDWVPASERKPPGAERVLRQCPSRNELWGTRCRWYWDHSCLCMDQNPDHGPWEDRYRPGFDLTPRDRRRLRRALFRC